MSRVSTIAIVGLILLISILIWWKRMGVQQSVERRVESRELAPGPIVLAAPGRVEGRGETISLGAGSDGVVKNVLVTDGQKVSQGALLAVINCEDIGAELEMAKAEADSARASRDLVVRGHRKEEREAAAQAASAAKADLNLRQEHVTRMDGLYQKGDVSREDFDKSKTDFEVAQANYQKAIDEENLLNAGPLPEEISRADAEVTEAERHVTLAAEKLDKCNVRAPISGSIVKVLTKAGEPYSTLVPHPLFTMADDSVRRVRAEVDERDIGKIKLGQGAIVTADGFPGMRFEGQVIEIGHTMQPNSVLTEDPAEKKDHDVLDVVIELKQSADDLPLGLRVTAQMTNVVRPLPVSSAEISQTSLMHPEHPNVAPISMRPSISGFALQVGAMKHRENADALAAILRKKGFDAFVLAREGDRFYRVEAGPYSDLSQARVAKDELTKSGFGTPIEEKLPTQHSTQIIDSLPPN